MDNYQILTELTRLLDARKNSAEASESYVASLHQQGLNKILEKLGEECVETILAAKDAKASGDSRHLISETADLWFHSLVMLSHLDQSADAVLTELARRFNVSGFEEKASRPQ